MFISSSDCPRSWLDIHGTSPRLPQVPSPRWWSLASVGAWLRTGEEVGCVVLAAVLFWRSKVSKSDVLVVVVIGAVVK